MKIIVGFLCIGMIVLGLYLLISSFSQKSASISQNNLITNETTIANSLDSPLFPNATWKKIDENLNSEDDINQVLGISKNDDYVYIPFTRGTFYKAQSSLEYPSLELFYEKTLEKDGWASSELQFKTFSLQALVADKPCNGISGYIGYKDGNVKLLSIQHKTVPCDLPSDPSYQNGKKPLAEYTIYISEPKPIKEIEDYIVSHSKSGL